MGLMDVFKSNENKQLKERIAQLETMMSPEQKEIEKLNKQINELQSVVQSKEQQINSLIADINQYNFNKKQLENKIMKKRSEIFSLDETIMFESFGLYKPKYIFANAEAYKSELNKIRAKQKETIKQGTAVTGYNNWTVNGSLTQGKKMVKDMQKLLLRAFNSECDELVDRVKYNNYDASVKRINSSADAISKLGSMMGVAISNTYKQLKLSELTLAFEYAQKKQEEKEKEKELRARMREEAKLQKEIEEARKKLEKEQSHYQNALTKIIKQLEGTPDSQELLDKKLELENKIADTNKAIKDVDYREANKRAGYVYVISNIGAFGENVYKIGMTRRLDPQERVDELGDASVPFEFDVHAMIFTDDAPRLENALHKAFENRKVNMVNQRREFFNVTLEEIKQVVRKNYDKTVEFFDYPEAEQFRVSLKMKEKLPHNK